MAAPLAAPAARRPGQGVLNVVRFNWPFYLGAGLAGAAGLALAAWLPAGLRPGLLAGLALGGAAVLASLLASAWVYDLAGLYGLGWLPAGTLPAGPATVLTVQAGFDEISAQVQQQWPLARVRALDFYDPARHTEASIARARAAYPPYPGTQAVATTRLPLPTASADAAVAFFSAHEIRDPAERAAFFGELRRVLRPGAPVIVVEHLRDLPNFLAYTVGFLHFHAHGSWLATFAQAGLPLEREVKVTPFVSAFLLRCPPDDDAA